MCQQKSELSIKTAFLGLIFIIVAHGLMIRATHGIMLGVAALFDKKSPDTFPVEVFRMASLAAVVLASLVMVFMLIGKFDVELKVNFKR